MSDPSDWINQFTVDVDAALTRLHDADPSVTRDEVQLALTEILGFEDPAELLHQELPSEKIVSLLSEYNFAVFRPETLGEVKLDESIIPQGVVCFLTEQEVKVNGQIWTIHKNDADPFPSSPHAHNYPENMIVHLGNGKLYRKRKEMGQLKKKKLLLLRGAIKGIELPPLDF